MDFNNQRTYSVPKYGTSPIKATNKSAQLFELCDEYFEKLDKEKVEDKIDQVQDVLEETPSGLPEIPSQHYTEYFLRQKHELSGLPSP